MVKSWFKVPFFLIIILAAFLRINNLDKVPPSLFADEVDAGYQAYSFLKTGKDYHGNFLPLSFQSFADFRTPLFILSLVPSIAIFGLNEWGVRIPSAFFGVLTVFGIYFLVKCLGFNKWIGIIASFLLSISPWHLQYSRAGFEVSLMMALIVWGVVFFLKGLKKEKFLFLSVLLFCFSIYTYSAAKLFIPLFIILLFIIYRKEILNHRFKNKVLTLLLLIVLLSPVAIDIYNGNATYRFSYTSVFADPTIPKEVDISRAVDSSFTDSPEKAGLISQLSHNKFLTYLDTLSKNYLSAFSTNFLFISGDYIGRHSVGKMGQFYFVEVVSILIGLLTLLLFNKTKVVFIIIGWLLLAPIPAALTVEGGNHATRLFLMLIPLVTLSSIGIFQLLTFFNKDAYKKTFTILFCAVFFANAYFYFHKYYIHYPLEQERLWHYGFKQAVLETNNASNYEKIVFSPSVESPIIFILFWTKYDPALFQKNKLELKELEGFDEKIPSIDKYFIITLPQGMENDKISEVIDNKTLLILSRKDIPDDLRFNNIRGLKTIDIIKYPSSEIAFYILAKE